VGVLLEEYLEGPNVSLAHLAEHPADRFVNEVVLVGQ